MENLYFLYSSFNFQNTPFGLTEFCNTKEIGSHNNKLIAFSFPSYYRSYLKSTRKMVNKLMVYISVYYSNAKLTNLMDIFLSKGEYQYKWNALDNKGKPIPTGIYIISQSQNGHFTKQSKIIKL